MNSETTYEYKAALWYIDEELMAVVTNDGRKFFTPEANEARNSLGQPTHFIQENDAEEFNLQIIALREEHHRLMSAR